MMKQTINLTVLFILLLAISNFPIAAQTVQWASKVIGVSSQFVDLDKPQSNQFKASQVLGKPDKLPAFGQSACAWSPAKANGSESQWIKVEFDSPMRIEQIAVAENYNPGAVSEIYAYEPSGTEHLLFRNINVGPIGRDGRMYRFFQKTSYNVKQVKVVLRTDRVPGFNQIDAIGISDSRQPIEAKINLAKDLEIKSKPQNLGAKINSRYQEIAPMISPDGKYIFFTRAKHPQNIGSPDKQDVWFAEINSDASFGNAQNVGAPINTSQHNSSFSISPDGNTMLLNNIYNEDGSLEKGLSITHRVKGGSWGQPKAVMIEDYYNNNPYSEFCLSQDGKVLLMTVQRNDSYGGKDIYVSFRQGERWSAPKNLGSVVNTAASETSPFLASDGKTLYYSTSGLSGYGSNDIFVSRRLDNTWQKWSEPQNLGPEINTPAWDAYFSIPAKADYAYYTSYFNSMGDSDIFRIQLSDLNKPDPVALIQGKVYNAKTKTPIEANIVYEILPEGKNVGQAVSNAETGDYKVVLPLEKNYAILAEAQGFIAIEENIDLRNHNVYEEITKNLYLMPIERNASFRLNNIFFERSRFNLLPESYPELNRLIKVLKDNPNLVIRLEGHTEIFGSKRDQFKLAENRVKSVKNYLVNTGSIDEERIKLKSYGGSRPISRDTDVESRALNRRVEIRILKN